MRNYVILSESDVYMTRQFSGRSVLVADYFFELWEVLFSLFRWGIIKWDKSSISVAD